LLITEAAVECLQRRRNLISKSELPSNEILGTKIRRLRLELKGHIPLVLSVDLLFPSAVARNQVLDVEIQSSLSF
jgi:hypothetical protein